MAVLAAGGTAYVLTRDDGAPPPAAVPRGDTGPIAADRLGVRTVDLPALRPAEGADGADGTLSDVAVLGDAFVVAGSVEAGGRAQPVFLRSSDLGSTWQPGAVADPEALSGGQDRPDMLTAGAAGALALGGVGLETVTWTSDDGLGWTRQASDPAVFQRTDDVGDVGSGPSGFLAAGINRPLVGDETGVLWDSADGVQWRRRTAPDLGIVPEAGTAGNSFSSVATRGETVVVVGQDFSEDSSSPQEVAIWTSYDGGATFSKTALPEGIGGSTGRNYLNDVAAGPDGFVAVGSGGDSPFDDYDPITVSSPDGRTWSRSQDAALSKDGQDYPQAVAMIPGGAIAVGLSEEDGALLVAAGETWRDDTASAGELLVGKALQVLIGVAVVQDVVVAVGYDDRTGDADPLLLRREGDGAPVPVDLPSLEEQSAPAGSPSAITSTDAGLVVVGSSTSDGAVWRSEDGASFQLQPDLRVPGPFTQTLLDVVASPDGSQLVVAGSSQLTFDNTGLALRSTAGAPFEEYRDRGLLEGSGVFAGRNLVAVAQRDDHTVWVGRSDEGQPEGGAFVVSTRGSSGLLLEGLSAGPPLPAVGSEASGGGAMADDLVGGNGLSRRMDDVAFGPSGLLAVGRATPARDVADAAATWTNSDGLAWDLNLLPTPAGLDQTEMTAVTATPQGWAVVGSGQRGEARVPLAWTSADGVTWTDPVELPGTRGASVTLSDLVSSPQGLVAVGQATGSDGRDAALWTSVDGLEWTAVELSEPARGRGQQSLAGVTVQGERVVAVGQAITPDAVRALVVTAPLDVLFP